MASLHAKVLVADARDALVHRPTHLYHGLEANVEVGVRVTGDAPRRLEGVFHELIRLWSSFLAIQQSQLTPRSQRARGRD